MTMLASLSEPIPGISPGVYGISDFREVARIVHDAAGIVLPQGKAMLVYSRLAPLVRQSGKGTFAAYLEAARNDHAELNRIVAALTTNHTFFYREDHHFEHFECVVRPGLVKRIIAGHSVRMWSAGCSSGEETWSLVMTLLGSDRREGASIAARDVLVLASDIAPHALARATAAKYPASDFKPVPSDLVQLWTQPDGDDLVMAELARAIVRFRNLNLQGHWPMQGQFDVIFCRNVMIYFDQPTKERLVARLAEMLQPGGYLYIGQSERVSGPATALLEPAGPTIYRRRSK
jgi:chemotaxis protein methyltransferase CheR